MEPKRNPGIVLLVILVILGLRLPYTFHTFLNIDEAIYATVAKSMSAGRLLYADVYEMHPPFIYLLYFLVARIFGFYNILAIHFVSLFWTLATTFFLFRFASYCYGKKTGSLTALLYAVFSTTAFSPSDMIAAKQELFMILPLVVSAYYFLRGTRESIKGFFFLAGFFCGLGVLFKVSGIFSLVAMGLYQALSVIFFRKSFKDAAAKFFWILAGWFIPVFLTGIYFLSAGTLKDLFFWTLKYGFLYTHQIPLLHKYYIFTGMLLNLVILNYLFWLFVVISPFCFEGKKSVSSTLFIWLWGVFSLAAASMGGRPFDHYFVQVIPPFAVLSALGISGLWKKITSFRVNVFVRKVIPGLIIFFGVFHSVRMCHGKDYWRKWTLAVTAKASSGDEVTDYITTNSREDEQIFVWGFSPEIYVLSRRLAASRFIITDFLIGITPGTPYEKLILIPGMPDLLIRDLRVNKPVFIIDTSPGNRFGYAGFPPDKCSGLNRLIQSDYRMVREGNTFRIYRRRVNIQ